MGYQPKYKKEYQLSRKKYERQLNQLMALGYSEQQAEQVMFCYARKNGVQTLIENHSSLINIAYAWDDNREIRTHRELLITEYEPGRKIQTITHQGLVSLLVCSRSPASLLSLLEHHEKLFAKGYDFYAVYMMLKRQGVTRIVERVLALTDQLTGMGFTQEAIARIVSHSSASYALDAVAEYASFLLQCGYSHKSIQTSAASASDGFPNIIGKVQACNQLLVLGFTRDEIKAFTHKKNYFHETNILEVLQSIQPMLDLGYSLSEIKDIIFSRGMEIKSSSTKEKISISLKYTLKLKDMGFGLAFIKQQLDCVGSHDLSAVLDNISKLGKMGFEDRVFTSMIQEGRRPSDYEALREDLQRLSQQGLSPDLIRQIAADQGLTCLSILSQHAKNLSGVLPKSDRKRIKNKPLIFIKSILNSMSEVMVITGQDFINAVSPLLDKNPLIQLISRTTGATGKQHYELWFELLKIGYEPDQVARIALRDDAIQSMQFILDHVADFLEQGVGSEVIQRVAVSGGFNALNDYLKQLPFRFLLGATGKEHYALWFELLKIGYDPEQVARIALRDDAIQSMQFILDHVADFLEQGVGSEAIQLVAVSGGFNALNDYLKQLPFRFSMGATFKKRYELWFELLKIGYDPEQVARIALRDDAIQSMQFILEHAADFLEQGVGPEAIQRVAVSGGFNALNDYFKQLPFSFAISGGTSPGFFASSNPALSKRPALEADDTTISKKHKHQESDYVFQFNS